MKWGLGTVQFGTEYGISNRAGQTPADEAGKILDRAWSAGFRMLDTAPAYGNSETVLGKFLDRYPDVRVVTKTTSVPEGSSIETWASLWHNGLVDSLSRLQVARVDAVLLHQPAMLAQNGPAVIQALKSLKDEGLTRRIGVSIYGATELDLALKHFRPDIVQLPVNVFDQRLIRSGHLRKLKESGIEVVARSAFLQGLLLMERGDIPASMARWSAHFDAYDRFLRRQGLSRLQAAIGFIRAQSDIDTVIVGACRMVEFEQILTAIDSLAGRNLDFAGLAVNDEDLLNPSRWSHVCA